MCKPKPGKRCAAHTRAQREKLVTTISDIILSADGPLTDGQRDQLATATQKLEWAMLDHWSTRDGAAELDQQAATGTPEQRVAAAAQREAAQHLARNRGAAAEAIRRDCPAGLTAEQQKEWRSGRDGAATLAEKELYLQSQLWLTDHDPARRNPERSAQLAAQLNNTMLARRSVQSAYGISDTRPDINHRCLSCGRFSNDTHQCPGHPAIGDEAALQQLGGATIEQTDGWDATDNPGMVAYWAACDTDEQRLWATEQFNRGRDLERSFDRSTSIYTAAERDAADEQLAPVSTEELIAALDEEDATATPAPTPAGESPVDTAPDLAAGAILSGTDLTTRYSGIDRTERVDRMQDDLKQAVRHVVESGQLGMLLDGIARSRLGRWSFNNKLLALGQLHAVRSGLPDDDPYKAAPPMLMSPTAWKREYGATPKKGTSAIWILRPYTKKITTTDPKTGKEETRIITTGFGAQAEFDISQMNGDRLPAAPAPRAPSTADAPPGAYTGLVDRVAKHGYTYSEQEIPGSNPATGEGTLGYTDPRTKQIVVDARCSPSQRVNVIAHELGHVLNGHVDRHDEYRTHRGQMETEAEATAYMVTRALGMRRDDADSFSADYIASWSKGDTTTIEKALTSATAAFNKIMDGDWPTTD